MMGSHAATSGGTHASTTARHAATSSGDAAAAFARGEAAISVRFASIQGRFSRTNDATNASAAYSGADTSTWPSAFTRRFTFLMRLRTSRTGSPSTSRVIVVGAAAPPRRLAVGRPVRPAPRPAMPLTP